jgi:hypothetical protein
MQLSAPKRFNRFRKKKREFGENLFSTQKTAGMPRGMLVIEWLFSGESKTRKLRTQFRFRQLKDNGGND